MTKETDTTDDGSQQRPRFEKSPPEEMKTEISRASGRPVLRIAVSCFFILAAAVFTQTPQYRKRQAAPPASGPDLRLQLMGRYMVGMKLLIGNMNSAGTQPLLNTALQSSGNSRQRLFTVPILAEVSGKEAVLVELERLIAGAHDPATIEDANLFLHLYRDGESSLSPRQLQSIRSYGWLGQLALSWGKSSSDPSRRAVVQSAIRTFVVIVVFTVGIILVIGTGFILLLVAVVWGARKRLPGRLPVPQVPEASLLEAFAIYIAGFLLLPALIRWLLPDIGTAASVAAVLPVAVAVFWPHIRGSSWKNQRMALGWHRGKGIFREMGAGILGYVAGLPLLLAATIPVFFLARHTGTMPAHPIMREIGRSPTNMFVWTGLACVWAPVVEETFFRGALYGYFRRHIHWTISAIVTGLLFAIVHPQGWLAVPLLATIGFNLSVIREWRGSLVASMTAHALNNGAVLLLLILAIS